MNISGSTETERFPKGLGVQGVRPVEGGGVWEGWWLAGQLWVLGSEPQHHLRHWWLGVNTITLLTCALDLSPFLFFFLIGTVNKSNVVTASTSIQLLDERKSPVVAGRQWISIDEYKISKASTYLASQLLLRTRKFVFKGKKLNYSLFILMSSPPIQSSDSWLYLIGKQKSFPGLLFLNSEPVRNVGVCRGDFPGSG